MTLETILDALFPDGHDVRLDGKIISGEAATPLGTVAVLGTADAAAMDHAIALGLSAFILETVARHPGRPFVYLVDTSGQALSRSEELLCLNGSLAHLAECVDLARRRGHPSLSLVTANAVSGGFLSYGLMADRVFALKDVQVRVMDLRAMSRVTRIEHEKLVELAGHSPICHRFQSSGKPCTATASTWSSAPCACICRSHSGSIGDMPPSTRVTAGLTAAMARPARITHSP